MRYTDSLEEIFPELTDFEAIIEKSHKYIDEYWFENLNLRGSYKQTIMNYISDNYANLLPIYNAIYKKGDKSYWVDLANRIEKYCQENNIKHINYFFHEKLVKEKHNCDCEFLS